MTPAENSENAAFPAYTPAAVATAAAVTVACAFALSLIYGPAEHYSPLVYLNVLLAVLLGMAVGHCGKVMLRRLRIDGLSAATAVGALGGLAAIWCSWLAYIWVLSGYDFGAFAAYANPAELWDAIRFIAENPVWSIGRRSASSTMPALLYYAVWLAEAGIVCGSAVKTCREFVEKNKRCPRCGDWLVPTGDEAYFAAPEDASLPAVALQGQGSLDFLLNLTRLSKGMEAGEWLTASRHACGRCEGLPAHVTLTRSTVAHDKKGKPEVTTDVVAAMVATAPALEAALFPRTEGAQAENALEHFD